MAYSSDHPIDIHEYCRQHRQVVLIWSIDDVQQQRPDLTDDQAWHVLQQCERAAHDCNFGFTWDLIDWVAENLYPKVIDTLTPGAGV